MIRAFLDRVEDWVMDDDNLFIGVGKMILVLAIFVAIIVGPFIYADAVSPSFELKKTDWACGAAHQEIVPVMVGKVFVPEVQTVCDEYHRIR